MQIAHEHPALLAQQTPQPFQRQSPDPKGGGVSVGPTGNLASPRTRQSPRIAPRFVRGLRKAPCMRAPRTMKHSRAPLTSTSRRIASARDPSGSKPKGGVMEQATVSPGMAGRLIRKLKERCIYCRHLVRDSRHPRLNQFLQLPQPTSGARHENPR